ncbi:MAG: acyltransferase [Deltaproteobacteria bacterium HGW-Deltaproteobacteria-14]|nr:MAG: acyltransferase [Deltaproteobacteria bacterium HGW-Deltaproteobacteria-14]
MPWLWEQLSRDERAAIARWQADVQARWALYGDVTLGVDCVIAPDVAVFAEPGRPIRVGDRCSIAAGVFLHGPITLGKRVSLHPRATLDGGRAGLVIGDGTRIANGATLFAYDYGLDPTTAIMDQPVTSRGIRIGADVWVGAGAGITDGVTVGDHAVIGMGAVVTRDVPDWAIMGGSPARVIGDRRDR